LEKSPHDSELDGHRPNGIVAGPGRRWVEQRIAPVDHDGDVATLLRPTMVQRVTSAIGCAAVSGMATTVAVTSPDFLLPVWIVIAVVTLPAAVRMWFLRVEIHPGELVVVNWIRTYHVPWTSVGRVEADDDGLLIRRRAGTDLRASAFQHDYRAFEAARRHSRAAAARLESARKQHRRRPARA
jgi:hypothetical protein